MKLPFFMLPQLYRHGKIRFKYLGHAHSLSFASRIYDKGIVFISASSCMPNKYIFKKLFLEPSCFLRLFGQFGEMMLPVEQVKQEEFLLSYVSISR